MLAKREQGRADRFATTRAVKRALLAVKSERPCSIRLKLAAARSEISARDAMTATETLTLTPSEQLAALETSLEASPPPADAPSGLYFL